MKHLRSVVLGFCLATAGCGGGGGTSGGSTSGGGTVVTPPTSPSPSPSPIAVIDFNQDLALKSQFGFALTSTVWNDSLGDRHSFTTAQDDWLPNGPSTAFSFRAADDTVRFTYAGIENSYSSADRSDQSGQRTYGRGGSSLRIVRPDSGYKYVFSTYHASPRVPYVVNGYNGTRVTSYFAMFGYGSTATSRMDGAFNRYPGTPLIHGARFSTDGFAARELELSVNSGTDRLIGILFLERYSMSNATPRTAILRVTGTLDDISNTFHGTISDTDRPETGYSGSFRGALYGPRRDELGMVFRFSSRTDPSETYVGEMLSKRKDPCGSGCVASGAP